MSSRAIRSASAYFLHVVEGGTGDDQRRPCLVDQNAVDLVDDRVMQLSLRLQVLGRLHVVAQVIEAELVIRAVGDVARVHLLALGGVHLRLDGPHRHPQSLKQRAHPLGVAAGQVVVDRHHVHATTVKSVQIGGQGGDQGLAFAGDHFGDIAAVQNHAAHQLDVEVAHVQITAARLAGRRERLGQEVVERFPRELAAGGIHRSWPAAHPPTTSRSPAPAR